MLIKSDRLIAATKRAFQALVARTDMLYNRSKWRIPESQNTQLDFTIICNVIYIRQEERVISSRM